MAGATRFGVSFDSGLVERFDRKISQEGYANRSEALRDLARSYVAKESALSVYAAMRVVSDQRVRHYQNRVASIENDYHCLILGTHKVFIGHHTCVETLTLCGARERIEKFVAQLREVTGVREVSVQFFSISDSKKA